MNRSFVNFFIDLIGAVSLLGMILTGYVLRFPLPPGTNRTHVLWGLARHDWGTLHFWCSIGLLTILVLHVALHWTWIVGMARRMLGRPACAPRHPLRDGILAVCVLLAAFSAFALAAARSVTERPVPLHPLAGENNFPASQGGRKSGPDTVSFWRDVSPIFTANCLGCHGPEKQKGDFRVDRREDFFGGADGPLVVPGNSKASRLVAIVSGQVPNMKSAEAHQLEAPEVKVIETWINQGAKWPEPPSGN